ncbi:hypothetical protein FB451DRAFT_1536038 [Mycena latifolia]|nr:hypothetical protein FB451DRAFT_1536038 [Mycena latifolia]
MGQSVECAMGSQSSAYIEGVRESKAGVPSRRLVVERSQWKRYSRRELPTVLEAVGRSVFLKFHAVSRGDDGVASGIHSCDFRFRVFVVGAVRVHDELALARPATGQKNGGSQERNGTDAGTTEEALIPEAAIDSAAELSEPVSTALRVLGEARNATDTGTTEEAQARTHAWPRKLLHVLRSPLELLCHRPPISTQPLLRLLEHLRPPFERAALRLKLAALDILRPLRSHNVPAPAGEIGKRWRSGVISRALISACARASLASASASRDCSST